MKNKLLKILMLILIFQIILVNVNVVQAKNSQKKISKVPIISKLVSSRNYVKLYWKNGKGSSKSYIYRKTNNGKYKKIAELNKKAKQYTDKKVTTGKKYYYKIVNKNKSKNYYSKVKAVTPVKIKAPKILNIKRYSKNNKNYAKLTWKAKKGYYYYIYRKDGKKSFSNISEVKSKSSECTYTDKIINNKEYTYTVRAVRKVNKSLNKLSSYDINGIKTIKNKPKVNVDTTNLYAKISWNKISGAGYYTVYRKLGMNGSYRALTTIKANNKSKYTYKDIFKNSCNSAIEKQQLCATNYIDPSYNKFIYTVRAYQKDKNNKISYSNYYIDGEYQLQQPYIINVKKTSLIKAEIEWYKVQNAKKILHIFRIQ
ncbi:hypothetical protein [Anaerofustis stercorihominis]|uniref:Fibronectin type III domain-containing protein n=1 Tax=Anaerofustis stercorihominis TaxID=214853 RepID=A0A3E3DYN5_9FIRM|nr:hypothetical protein [Anaerofustis stercorihominis]RGD74382.1 hypothetical protein DW687_06345 [Anaerofustis stercorihominis]